MGAQYLQVYNGRKTAKMAVAGRNIHHLVYPKLTAGHEIQDAIVGQTGDWRYLIDR
jgi:hypothetical protein